MKKVLIIYFSLTGTTQKMAEYIAEGVRFSDAIADAKGISDIVTADNLKGYDGYILGAPTVSLDVPEPMKAFLDFDWIPNLSGKLGGAFGPYRHEVSYAPGAKAAEILYETLQSTLAMVPFELGPLRLKESIVNSTEGLRACQAYGKAFGEKLNR